MINELTGLPLTEADIAALRTAEQRLEHGAQVEADALAQARITARYRKTLIAEEVPPELADSLTLNFHNYLKEHRFWVRPGEPAKA